MAARALWTVSASLTQSPGCGETSHDLGCEDGWVSSVLPPAVAAVALADAEAAVAEYEGAIVWFSGRVDSYRMPIAVEVWVLDPTLTRVLLVEHRWRGWVPPGGKAERGEVPRAAAARELLEETGLSVDLLPRTAAAMVRADVPGRTVVTGTPARHLRAVRDDELLERRHERA